MTRLEDDLAKKKEPLLSKEDWKFIGRIFLISLVFGFLGSCLTRMLIGLPR